MKKIFILITLVFITNNAFAECISKEPQVLSDVMEILHCLQNEINTLKGREQNSSKNIIIKSFEKTTKASISKSVNLDGFQVDLLNCKRRGTSVVCSLEITNLGKDERNFRIMGYEFIDELGEGEDTYKFSDNGKVSRKFFTNVTVKDVKFIINNVPEDRTQFIKFYIKVEFRGAINFKHVAILK